MGEDNDQEQEVLDARQEEQEAEDTERCVSTQEIEVGKIFF